MSILEMALSISIGIWGAESSHSTDPRAYERGHHAAGPLQITRVLCEDFNQHNPSRRLVWPDDFLAGDSTWGNSERVYLWTLTHYGPTLRGRVEDVTARDLALLWRYGRAGCLESHFSDPDGYWERVQQRNGKKGGGG